MVAVRERHEGLLGWLVRRVAAIPAGIAAVLRGFFLEVLGVLGGMGRALLRLVPGSSLLPVVRRAVATTAAAPSRGDGSRGSVRGTGASAVPAARPRVPRTEAQQRAWLRRRELLRRRLRIGALGLGAALLVAGWIVVPGSDAFRIRHLEVTGASSVGDLEVRARIDELLAGKTVFTVDEGALARQVEELPFVREVRVERHLPGGLQLHVVEYRPLALGYGDGGFWLVARDGRLLAKASQDEWSGRIPTVALEGRDLKAGMRVADEPSLRLLAARTAGSTVEFETVEVGEYELTARLAGDIEVQFGRPDLLNQKVLVVERMLREARRLRVDLLYIDVSVPSRPAICSRDSVACNMARGGTGEADGDGDAAAITEATTPEETGGDVAAATASEAGGEDADADATTTAGA